MNSHSEAFESPVSQRVDSETEIQVQNFPPELLPKTKSGFTGKPSVATRSKKTVIVGLLPEIQANKRNINDETPGIVQNLKQNSISTIVTPPTFEIDLENLFKFSEPQNNNNMSAVALIPLLLELGPDEKVSQFFARYDTRMGILPDVAQKDMLACFILEKIQSKARKVAGAATWAEIKTALATPKKNFTLGRGCAVGNLRTNTK